MIDPGFLRGGASTIPVETPTSFWSMFPEKLHPADGVYLPSGVVSVATEGIE